MRNLLCGAACLLFVAAACFSQQIPKTQFTTLTGADITIPKEASRKPLVLLLTFSQKGSADLPAWNKHFKVKYETDPRVDYYELADFQGVPSLIMKMILHGMRRSVQEPEKSHLGPFYTHEQEWKKLVGFSDPDVTYALVADGSGHVIWQARGPANAEKAAAMEAAIAK